MKTSLIHLSLISTLALALALVSCATSKGPQFSGLAPVPPGQASLYIYRNSSLAAIAQSFDVKLDGKCVGKLYNASYLQLPVTPGKHTLQIAPGGLAVTLTRDITAGPGHNYFQEFDFPKALPMDASFIGSSIVPRDGARALADLKALRRAS